MYSEQKVISDEEDEINTFFYLRKAHELGIESIITEELLDDPQNKKAKFKATVKLKDGSVFTAHGDADPSNIKFSQMLNHYYRFAETRAISRALRFATCEGKR